MNAANSTTLRDSFIQKLTQVVLDNLDNENFGVSELSQFVGISRSHLHRKIQASKNQSVSQFIREIRLNEAYKLLRNDNLTASEVAYRVGFNNPSYFNKVFTEHFKTSPGKVLKNPDHPVEVQHAYSKEKKRNTVRTKPQLYKIGLMITVFGIAISGGVFLFINNFHSTEKSVAILPLVNLTGQAENNYFVAGMHDGLIGELSQVGSIRVISRTSTLRYKDTSMVLKNIAKELDVNIIVEASLKMVSDSILLMVQVIDVFPKERHLFAKEYGDVMSNVLKVQNLVAKDISRKINVNLTNNEKNLLNEERKVNPEIYKAYLRGMYYVHQGTRESYEKGIEFLYEAIEKDPGDPFAYAGLALAFATKGHGQVDSEEAFNIAVTAANHAIRLDSTIDEAYTALAILYLYDVWDWTKTRSYFESALVNNPNNLLAHAHVAWYHVLFNDYEKAIYHAKKAVMLQPFSASFHAWLSIIYFKNKQYKEAEYYANKALMLKEDIPYGNVCLGWIRLEEGKYQQAIEYHEKLPKWSYYQVLLGQTYVKAGQREKAMKIWHQLDGQDKKVNSCHMGMMAAYLGFTDKAFELLNEAYEDRKYPITYLNFYPCTEGIRNDPRYQELLKKMNLPYTLDLIASK